MACASRPSACGEAASLPPPEATLCTQQGGELPGAQRQWAAGFAWEGPICVAGCIPRMGLPVGLVDMAALSNGAVSWPFSKGK